MIPAMRNVALLCVALTGASTAALAQDTALRASGLLSLTTSSPDARAAYQAAREAAFRQDWVKWREQIERAVTADPRFALARADRSFGLVGAEARAEVERAFVLSLTATPAERIIIHAARESHESRPADFLLRTASSLAPNDDLLLGLAQGVHAYGSSFRVESARELARRNPSSAALHANLARSLAAPADSAESRRAAEEALRLGPREPAAHNAMGLVMLRRGNHGNAATHLRQALQLNPDYLAAHWQLAEIALYEKRFADARQHLAAVSEASPLPESRAEARRASALMYLHERDMVRAVRAMTEAAQSAEADGRLSEAAFAHRHLAVFAAARKDEAGIREHTAAQERMGRAFDAFHQYWIAVCWALAGRPTLARQAVHALEQENRNGDVTVAATTIQTINGIVLQAEGKHEEALAVLANNPNQLAIMARVQALRALGRRAEADHLVTSLLEQTGFGTFSTAMPVARYLFEGADERK